MFLSSNVCIKAMIKNWYEITNRTWGAFLAESAARYPDRELIVYHDQRVTYRDFYERVQAFSRGLLALGVKRGNNLALWVANCPEWMVAQSGTYEIGAALVPIHTRFSKDETAYALEKSEASTLRRPMTQSRPRAGSAPAIWV